MRQSRIVRIATTSAAIAAGALVSACGGGGGASTPPPPPTQVSPPPPPSNQGPTWTQNVFEPASTFKDQCQSPRSGTDIEGNTFPDQAGSLIEEQLWLRSWTEETYLWNDEVVDQDPNGFATAQAYFDVLKTDAVEPSGEDRDDFHFSELTTDFLIRRNSVGNPGYGAELAIIRGGPPRDIRVAYTEPNSPASTPISGVVPLPRGARILQINGQDIVNGFNTQAQLPALNELLFPSTSGEDRTFLVQDVDGTQRSFTITTADITEKPVLTTQVISSGGGTVGYIAFNTFSPFASQEEIILAMRDMQTAGVDDLVLDLRYNGGGLLAVAAQTAYMIAGASRTSGNDFERFIFNDDAGNLNPVDGTPNDPFPFFNTVLNFGVPLTTNQLSFGEFLPQLNLNRVYILSTGGTCSASEAVINGLRGIDVEVVLIGDTTCGKPYGFFPQDNCGRTYYTIQFQGANNKDFAAYADGFVPNNSSAVFGVKIPGCVVADDFTKALGDPTEALLAAALNYRLNGTCPANTVAPKTLVASKSGPDAAGPTLETSAYYLRDVRDLRRPN